MRALKVGIIAVCGMLSAVLTAQHRPSQDARPQVPDQVRQWPSATVRFLASEQGRAMMQVTGDPLSQYFNQAFGYPSAAAVEAARNSTPAAAPAQAEASAPAGCSGISGARFNLEPRPGAQPQQNAAADFIPNGAGPGADLIVQTANDWRGAFPSATWDNSMSGYYVHRSSTADCSVQFEGGLPNFAVQGKTALGAGDAAVVADPTRGAFFMADMRFGPVSGIGLFRASAANLLNAANCPNGTHLQAQAASCWMQTPPVLVNPVSEPFFTSEINLAVDERAAGTGAGDVYLAANAYITSLQTYEVFVAACTNATLQCSPPVILAAADSAFPYVQVRADGVVTLSYLGSGGQLSFATCQPAGAPATPVCGQPVMVTTIANPLPTNARGELITPLNGIDNFVVFTYPKHANRREAGGGFTTFMVYDDCRNPYTQPPPPKNFPTICMNAEVKLTYSTDNGRTWSPPVSADSAAGHHFYPSIAADQSTGTVNIVYYSTEGDRFHHQVRVLLNQIAAGSTAIGPAKAITQAAAPMDIAPGGLNTGFDDFHLGAVARGTGTAGQSRLYVSFNRTLVNGIYSGRPLAEKNNHISLFPF